jgi:dUTP pyrophosphatase
MSIEAEDKIVEMWHRYHVPVKVKKLDPRATIPQYHTQGAVAFDIHAIVDEGQVIRVEPHSQKNLSTGLAMAIPQGYELRVSPRSGQAFKNQISIRNSPGIIDSDYTGEIKVCFVNNSDQVFIINPGDRICQVKLSMAPRAVFEEVEELDKTERGESGFGSTGK